MRKASLIVPIIATILLSFMPCPAHSQGTAGIPFTMNSQRSQAASIDVPFAVNPPQIDGRKDDPAWGTAAEINLRINNGPYAGKTPLWSTSVLLMWDYTNLYVLFTCYDRNILNAQQDQIDPSTAGDVSHEDEVQMVASPSGNMLQYYLFTFDPNGQALESILRGMGGREQIDRTWSPGLRHNAKVRRIQTPTGFMDRSWTVEAAIPWSAMGSTTPRVGSSIPVNFHRVDNSATDHYSAWCPMFQAPPYSQRIFGTLRLKAPKYRRVNPNPLPQFGTDDTP
jgi:hypothetical protein